MKYLVIKEYNDAPANPIKLVKGEDVQIIKESDPSGDWPNWIYCRVSKNEGWIPSQVIESDGKHGIITEDYDATEINVVRGEIVNSDKELNRWLWGTKNGQADQWGWIPLNCVDKL